MYSYPFNKQQLLLSPVQTTLPGYSILQEKEKLATESNVAHTSIEKLLSNGFARQVWQYFFLLFYSLVSLFILTNV